MVKTLKLALVVATAILSPYNLIFAEAQELQYAMLPQISAVT